MGRKPSVYARFDPDELRRLYIDERKTIREVARALQVGNSTALAAMMYWRIPRRAGGPGRQLPPSTPTIESSTLQRLYLEERHSIPAIAALLQVPVRSVRHALIQHRIPARRGTRAGRIR